MARPDIPRHDTDSDKSECDSPYHKTAIKQGALVMLAQMLFVHIQFIIFPEIQPTVPQFSPYILHISTLQQAIS